MHTRDHALYVACHGLLSPAEKRCVINPPSAHPRAIDPRRGGATMDAFTAGLLQRIQNTESDLSRARETGDDFLVEVELAELDDLRRLAAEHGVEVGALSA
ncbi:hypothetical protein [Streptomyces albus]|uniref:hypothetical protein n=1 Tax=Streptomyces albus TaxID=1888 RepID=UPI000ACB29BB|nr:hypothetical protein [Streptomyces albus]